MESTWGRLAIGALLGSAGSAVFSLVLPAYGVNVELSRKVAAVKNVAVNPAESLIILFPEILGAAVYWRYPMLFPSIPTWGHAMLAGAAGSVANTTVRGWLRLNF
jgi:hypothetical protein